MIKSFTDRETETIITRQRSGTLPPDIRQMALRQQYMLYSDVPLVIVKSLLMISITHAWKQGDDWTDDRNHER